MLLDQIPNLAGFGEADLDAAFAKLAAEFEDSANSLLDAGAEARRTISLALAWPQARPAQSHQRCLAKNRASRSQKKLIGKRFNES